MADVSIFTRLFGTSQVKQGLLSLGRDIDRLGQQVRQTGTTLTTHLTLPIVGMAAGALKFSGDFEKAMNQVQAITNATETDFKKLSKQARELGASTQFSASEAADAMNFLAVAGLDVKEIMGAMPMTLKLAASAKLDMARAADIVTNVMAAFGEEVGELDRVTDVLVGTFVSANTDLTQLAQAMKFAGPVAKGFNQDIESTAAILGILANAGFQASLGGTALRGMMTRLAAPSKEAAGIIKDLGIQVFDTGGKMLPFIDIIEQIEKSGVTSTEIMELFGQRAGPGMQALLTQGTPALRELDARIRGLGGVTERVAAVQMRGFFGALRELSGAVEELGIAVGDAGLREWATDLALGLTGLIRDLSVVNPELLKVGSIILGLTATVGPLLIALGLMMSAFGKLAKILVLLAAGPFLAMLKVLKGIRTVLLVLLSPIGLIVAALGGLLVVTIAIRNQWETIKGKFVEIWDSIARGVTNSALDIIGALKDLAGAGAAIDPTGAFEGLETKLVDIEILLRDKLVNSLHRFESTSSAVQTSVEDVFDTISGEVGKMMKSVADAGDEFINTGKIGEETSKELADVLGLPIDELKDMAREIVKTADETVDFGKVGDFALKKLSQAIDGARNVLRSYASTSSTTSRQIITHRDAERESWAKYLAFVQEGAKKTDRDLKNTFGAGAQKAFEEYFTGLKDHSQRAHDFVTGSVLKPMEDALTEFFSTGKVSFGDFFDAVKTGLARLAAQSVVEVVGGALGLGNKDGGGGGLLGGVFSGISSGIGSAIGDNLFSGDFFSGIGDFFGNLFSFAQGGRVRGAGSGTSDSILARLSDGEFVVSARQAQRFAPLLEAINQGQVPGFAEGGQVGVRDIFKLGLEKGLSQILSSSISSALGLPSFSSALAGVGASLGFGVSGGIAGLGFGAGTVGSIGAQAAVVPTFGAAAAGLAGALPTLGISLIASLVVSQLLGKLMGGETVGPNASARIKIVNGRAVLGDVGADNGGQARIAEQMGMTVVNMLNALRAITGQALLGSGGTAVGYFPSKGGAFGGSTGSRQFFGSDAQQAIAYAVETIIGEGAMPPGAITAAQRAQASKLASVGTAIGALPKAARGLGAAPFGLIADLLGAFAGLTGVSDGIMSGLPSLETGGSRIFTRPSLLSVAENGPERITGQPLAGRPVSGDGNSGVNIYVTGPAIWDDITLARFARTISTRAGRTSTARVFAGRQSRYA